MFGWLKRLFQRLFRRRANILYVWFDDDGRMHVEEISSLGNSQEFASGTNGGQDDSNPAH